VGHRACLDSEVRGKILLPLTGFEPRSPGRPVCSQTLYWLSYPGSVTSTQTPNPTPEHNQSAILRTYLFKIQPPCSFVKSVRFTIEYYTELCKQHVMFAFCLHAQSILDFTTLTTLGDDTVFTNVLAAVNLSEVFASSWRHLFPPSRERPLYKPPTKTGQEGPWCRRQAIDPLCVVRYQGGLRLTCPPFACFIKNTSVTATVT
jgi:hypothetical protein